MSTEQVTAKAGQEDNSPTATINYDFGDNLDEMMEKFGEEVVFNRAKSSFRIDLQALVRRHLDGENPKGEKEIQAIADEWTPGVSKIRKSTKQKAQDAIEKLSPEERQELLESLM